MSEDDLPPLDDLDAWKARFGEYRHEPLARYGAFRIDREWDRWPSRPGQLWSRLQLVFEVNDQYEFEVIFDLDIAWYRAFRAHLAEGQIPTQTQTLRAAIAWWASMRPTPEGGEVSLACYRRRVGPADDEREMTPGEWYIGPLFRRPSDPMISMTEAAPFVEAALRELEQLEQSGAADETREP
ncbi:MAG TPA: hypothetical protein VFN78_06850 [Ktedonobacterales bacterium]|nr:hypothetical protein [Ktedonobacterales bacterium]